MELNWDEVHKWCYGGDNCTGGVTVNSMDYCRNQSIAYCINDNYNLEYGCELISAVPSTKAECEEKVGSCSFSTGIYCRYDPGHTYYGGCPDPFDFSSHLGCVTPNSPYIFPDVCTAMGGSIIDTRTKSGCESTAVCYRDGIGAVGGPEACSACTDGSLIYGTWSGDYWLHATIEKVSGVWTPLNKTAATSKWVLQ